MIADATIERKKSSTRPGGVAGRATWVHVPTPGDHYSPRTGSAIITVINQMSRWHAAAGGRSRVIVARGTWDGYDDGTREEVAFRRLGTPARWRKVFDRAAGVVTDCRPLSGAAYAEAAAHVGRDFDGVVFVHNEPAGVEAFADACPRARVCLWVQNSLFGTYADRQVRRVIERAHRVVCCSDYIRRGIAARARLDATGREKLVVVLNGVDCERFRPAPPAPREGPPVILFVGRLVPEKGIDLLLRAAAELVRRGLAFRLRIVGSQNFNADDAETPYQRHLAGLAEAIGEHVTFEPFKPRDAIAGVYREAAILCVPSNWDDPCPLAVLEGLASGLAVVASNRGGIPEEVGDAADLFAPPDVTGLADRLHKLISEPARLAARAAEARARAEQLTWERQYHDLDAQL